MKNKCFLYFAISIVLIMVFEGSLLARSKNPYYFRMDLGVLNSKYSDRTSSDAKGTSGISSEYELSGSLVNLGMRIGKYEFEIEQKSATPKEDAYLDKRNEFYFHFMAYPEFFPYLGPSFGYYSLNQSGSSKEGLTDPFSFLEKNAAFVFGLNTYLPWNFSKKHALFLNGKYLYLSTVETSRNFGNENQVGVGYLYVMKGTRIGLKASSAHQFFFAQRPEDGADDQFSTVRSSYPFRAYTLHVQFQ